MAEHIEINIRQESRQEVNWFDRLVGWSWWWQVVRRPGYRILASGFARTEAKARAKAEKAAREGLQNYTYTYTEED